MLNMMGSEIGKSMKKVKNEISEEYFVEVVQQEKDLMFRLAYNIVQNVTDAEDAVADSICKAWEKKDRLKSSEKLRSWILRITINTSKSLYSKRKRVKPVDDFEKYYDEVIQMEETSMWSLVTELGEKERTVTILYYYREFSVKEIAEILKIPTGTVKSRLSSARKKLRKMM